MAEVAHVFILAPDAPDALAATLLRHRAYRVFVDDEALLVPLKQEGLDARLLDSESPLGDLGPGANGVVSQDPDFVVKAAEAAGHPIVRLDR